MFEYAVETGRACTFDIAKGVCRVERGMLVLGNSFVLAHIPNLVCACEYLCVCVCHASARVLWIALRDLKFKSGLVPSGLCH